MNTTVAIGLAIVLVALIFDFTLFPGLCIRDNDTSASDETDRRENSVSPALTHHAETTVGFSSSRKAN